MIRGTTKLIPMFGTPLAGVRAPTLFNAYFEKINADAILIPMEVQSNYPAAFREVLKVSNVVGALVTFPYKRNIDLADAVSPASEVAQACNVIVKRPDGTLYGDIFDGVGFAMGLRRAGFNFENARCLLVGCGGAGAAVAAALISFGVSFVGVSGRNVKEAQSLTNRLNKYAGNRAQAAFVSGDPEGYNLVVNATPLGMKDGDPLPFDITRVCPGMTVADLVMGQETALLRAAAARGCKTQPGTRMLFGQLSPVSEFWGYPPVGFDEVIGLAKSLGWNA